MAELKDAEIAQAVSEAVERIVEALEEDDRNPADFISQICRDFEGNTFKKHTASIALLRSRDWSKGEG
jgi:hypothetical protein